MSAGVHSYDTAGRFGSSPGALRAEDMAFVRKCLQRGVPLAHIARMTNRSVMDIQRVTADIQSAEKISAPIEITRKPNQDIVLLSLFRGLIVRKPGVKEIVDDVAREWGVTAAALAGPQTHKSIVLPRHDLMYRLHATGRFSTPEIGRLLGGRDHTTILHGIRQHKKRMEAAAA